MSDRRNVDHASTRRQFLMRAGLVALSGAAAGWLPRGAVSFEPA